MNTILFFVFAIASVGTVEANLSFVEVSDSVGLPDLFANSATLLDIDDDGDEDLFFVRKSDEKLQYYENENGVFIDQSHLYELFCLFELRTIRMLDYDSDGDLDIFGVDEADQSLRLFERSGVSFSDVTPDDWANDGQGGSRPQVVDFDCDGDPDILYHAERNPGIDLVLLRNDGGIYLEELIYDVPDDHAAGDFVLFDANNDGYLDLALTSMVEAGCLNYNYRTSPYTLLVNNMGIDMTDLGSAGIPDMSIRGNLGASDFNNDGYIDICNGTPDFICNGGEEKNWIVKNNGDLSFTDISDPSMSVGSHYYDYMHSADVDLDGDLDYFQQVETWTHSRLFLNNNDGTFQEVSDDLGITYHAGRDGSAENFWTDFDQDGDLDLLRLVRHSDGTGTILLYRNDISGLNWLTICTHPQISITSQYGLRVVCYSGGRIMSRWLDNYSSKMIHFGLDQSTLVDSLVVHWPSGVRQTLTEVDVDQKLDIFELGPPEITLLDIPNDQGGFLSVEWPAFPTDALDLPDSVETYDVQRLEAEDWMTLETIQATQSEAYQVTVTTDDIYIIGELEPYSSYRVVGNSSSPGVMYFSVVDSAYSVDNMSPPQPIVTLHESGNIRVFDWEVPDIPDYDQACLFRREQPEDLFTLLECTTDPYLIEIESLPFYYAVVHRDVHGNESEFSEAVYPVDVPESLPFAFALNENRPNPFNPQTVIDFDIPKPCKVRMAIYSIDGKQVAVIVDEGKAAGSHTVYWNGQDSGGRTMPSGTYFYRLEVEGYTATKRMTLIR